MSSSSDPNITTLPASPKTLNFWSTFLYSARHLNSTFREVISVFDSWFLVLLLSDIEPYNFVYGRCYVYKARRHLSPAQKAPPNLRIGYGIWHNFGLDDDDVHSSTTKPWIHLLRWWFRRHNQLWIKSSDHHEKRNFSFLWTFGIWSSSQSNLFFIWHAAWSSAGKSRANHCWHLHWRYHEHLQHH